LDCIRPLGLHCCSDYIKRHGNPSSALLTLCTFLGCWDHIELLQKTPMRALEKIRFNKNLVRR
ncbi:hypothetical protein T08_5403, partial [Trichinella sp. T8]